MWVIVVLVLVVIVVAIVVYLLGQGNNARSSNVATHSPPSTSKLPPPPSPPVLREVNVSTETRKAIETASADARRRDAEIEAALGRINSLNFKDLTDLHYKSMQTADGAYGIYKSTQVSSRAISSSISDLDRYLDSLKVGVSRGDSRWAASRDSSLSTRKHLVQQARSLQTDTSGLLLAVQSLNAKTHTFKVRIRDECGPRGRDWYTRLESRRAGG